MSICSAAHHGNLQVIRELASQKVDLNTSSEGKNGKEAVTPLFLAAQQGHAEAVELLVELKADVNLGNAAGQATPIFVASLKGHAKVVAALAGLKADCNLAMEGGSTPLFIAALKGRTDAIRMLVDMKGNVNQATNPMLTRTLETRTVNLRRWLGVLHRCSLQRIKARLPPS